MMDAGLLALGVAVAKLVFRAVEDHDAADGVQDAYRFVSLLSGMGQKHRASDPIGKAIAQRLSQQLQGSMKHQVQDINAAAMDVADLMSKFANDPDAILAAAMVPETFRTWAMRHGAARLKYRTARHAVSTFDAVLEVACEQFAALAPVSRRFQSAVLLDIARNAREMPDVAADVRAALDTLCVVVDQLAEVGTRTEDMFDLLAKRATRKQVIDYLEARLHDWDTPIWSLNRQPPSQVERQLRVKHQAGAGSVEHPTADDALDNMSMLVVLGGPGSGKTWLAQRYARRAAKTALAALDLGRAIADVEIPIFTTWDRWTKSAGSLHESLLSATFASGSGHTPFPPDVTQALRRSLSDAGQPVIVIVDSLDEAAGTQSQTQRLAELRRLRGWRTVVTSRPAAWHATYRRDQIDEPTVVTLDHFSYPDDVNGFIEDWFGADTTRAVTLIEQVRDRRALRRSVVNPLILTFYCALAAEAGGPITLLPVLRSELYNELLSILLRGGWRADAPGFHNQPDDTAEAVLRQWAWHAVKDQNTAAASLGAWGEVFIPPRGTVPAMVDHVVPPESGSSRLSAPRRFLHRTILEHLVAEHIATLPTSEAEAHLIPHLWFDSDWAIAAPAAIAAHNRHRPGELLDRILSLYEFNSSTLPRAVANRELTICLLSVAAESDPTEWSQAHRQRLHDIRRSQARYISQGVLDGLLASAHWVDSNRDIYAGVLAALPTAPTSSSVNGLMATVVGLARSDADHAQAREAIMNALHPAARPWQVDGLVAALLELDANDDELARVRGEILSALPTARPGAAGGMVSALVNLVRSDPDRNEAREAIMDALRTAARPWHVDRLAAALVGLVRSDPERNHARDAILTALPTTPPGEVERVLGTLVDLVGSATEREELRSAILAALPTSDPGQVDQLAATAVSLVVGDAERGKVRDAILAALRTARPRQAAGLVAVLVDVRSGAGGAERDRIRGAILAALPTAPPDGVASLVEALGDLGAGDAERKQARGAILAALSTARPWAVERFATALVDLIGSDAEGKQVRGVILAALPTARPRAGGSMVAALARLDPGETEREQASLEMLRALAFARRNEVGGVLAALVSLIRSDTERENVRRMIRVVLALGSTPGKDLSATFPTTRPQEVVDLLAALVGLIRSDAERERVRRAILTAFPSAIPGHKGDLVATLIDLVRSDAERDEARHAMLAALPSASPWETGRLAAALLKLGAADVELDQARDAIMAALTASSPREMVDLAAVLGDLVSSDTERDQQLRPSILAALRTASPKDVPRLVAFLRSSSRPDLWMNWLLNPDN